MAPPSGLPAISPTRGEITRGFDRASSGNAKGLLQR